MTRPTRTRVTDTACPRCGAVIEVEEFGITAGYDPEPFRWVELERRCPSGCHLIDSNFTAEDR
ncbi:hypothetical protein [Geodermatophilus sp. CPCC 205506]|uniref:hypothetical protein n=1 Tax=Geodermatophilus sp. CPCC 205506 TaxID=2936596 RepID=UPI003EEE74F2